MYISSEAIQVRINGYLAPEIRAEYKDTNPVLLVVLKGATYFGADLSRALMIPHELDFIHVTSYEGMISGPSVRLLQAPSIALEGRRVLIVEDIVDTGKTADFLVNMLRDRVQSIKIATLLAKPTEKNNFRSADFVGFEIPDEFVIGYGMDYNEQYRDLPFITTISEVERAGSSGYPHSSEWPTGWGDELGRRATLPGGLPG